MERLVTKMMELYSGDPGQIQHFLKVHSLAGLIALGEGVGDDTRAVLEIAAIVHDIGIKAAMQTHGSSAGKFQELEGPAVAERMLCELGYPEDLIRRVCFLVGHHHTYTAIDGIDYQILVEADFLVNMQEGGMSAEAIGSVLQTVFRTGTGKRYCRTMFGVDDRRGTDAAAVYPMRNFAVYTVPAAVPATDVPL